jgi:hypothetical protein
VTQQRELAAQMVADIDICRRKTKTAHTDQARARLRAMLETENWETAYVTHQLGMTRLKWLMSQGNWRAQKWLRKEEARIESRGSLWTQEDNQ